MFKFMIEGVKDNLDEKLKSPFWGSMIVTWLTWNWEVWYTTLFVSEELTGNKVIYIKEMYNYFDFYNLFPCIGIIFHWIIMPLLLSWFIIIFVTPKISLWFKEKHRNNKIEENKIKIEEIRSETKVLKAEGEKVDNELAIEKKKEKTEEEKWDEEYEVLNKKYPKLVSDLERLFYTLKGKINNSDWERIFDVEKEKNLHVNNLIEQTGEEYGAAVYTITKKGIYFLKKMTLLTQ